MGGGDLNLKKSWHPHTIKNQEKVWKAEQAKTQEEKKLFDLRREIEEEKNREELKRIGRESGVLGSSHDGDKKLDWMYKSTTELINREEYLLGRKIDKSYEILQAEERDREQQNLVGVKQPLNHVEHECVPFSIRAYKNLQNSEQVDLQRKVMEDPLMLIKQQEMESRRKILENPVKLKELHRMLKTDKKLRKKSKKIKKRKNSKKKHNKRTKSSSSSSTVSSDSASDLDSKLAKKLKKNLLSKAETSGMNLSLPNALDSKFEKIAQELDKAAGKRKKRFKKNAKESDDLDIDSNSNGQGQLNRCSRPFLKDRRFSTTSVSGDRAIRYNNWGSRSPATQNYFSRSGSKTNSRSRDITIKKHGRKLDSVSQNKKHNVSQRLKHRSRSRSKSFRKNIEREARSFSKSRDNHTANRTCSSDGKERKRRESRSSPREYRNSNKRSTKSRDQKQRSISKSPSKSITSSRSQTSSFTAQRSRNLTEVEKQAKLCEMMSNAAWREEERTEVVRKHREAYTKEEESHNAREFDKDFLNKEVKKAIANQTSVGSRLRANLNNIQRTSSAMNSNFARK